MRIGAIDDSRVISSPGALPIELEQRTDTSRSVASALLALPFAGLTGLLVGVAAQSLLIDPDGLVARPATSLGLVGATLLTGLIAAVPLSAAFARLGRRQSVSVTGDEVRVRECSLLGDRQWRAPLSSFAGVAHRIRSSLSGVRHEIVLVHADPSRSILLAIAPRVTLADLERMAETLRRPVIRSDVHLPEPAVIVPVAVRAPDYHAQAA